MACTTLTSCKVTNQGQNPQEDQGNESQKIVESGFKTTLPETFTGYSKVYVYIIYTPYLAIKKNICKHVLPFFVMSRFFFILFCN